MKSGYEIEPGDFSSVIVIIPTLNEEKTISEVISQLKHLGFHDIIVIDGNSKDGTAKVAKDLGVKVIHQNGHGKGAAMRQAFGAEEINGASRVVIMDADGSMNPKELYSFIETLGSKNVDLVKGSRFMPKGYSEDMTLIRKFGNTLFVKLVNSFWSSDYSDLCYGFAAFRKDSLDRLYPLLNSTNFEIETEMFIKAKKIGLTVAEVPSIELKRRYGKSNLNALRDGIKILVTIFKEAIQSNGKMIA